MKGRKREKFLMGAVGLFILLTVMSGMAYAVPMTFNYQGYLVDSNGDPVDGTVNLTFRIYTVSTGGSDVWNETHASVPVGNGVFNVILGESTALTTTIIDGERYLGVEVESDGEMTPRQKLTGVAFSIRAGLAESVVDGIVTTDSLSDNAVNEAKIANGAVTSGKLSGGASLAEILDDDGTGSNLDSDLLDGLDSSVFMLASTDNWVDETGDTMTGKLAVNGSSSYGSAMIDVTNSGEGNGIYAVATDTQANGIIGEATGWYGRGVYGKAVGTSGVGVDGFSNPTDGLGGVGGSFYAGGSQGRAVSGYAADNGASINYGGHFMAISDSSRGVYGYGKGYDFYAAGTGTNYGPFTGAHEAVLTDNFPEDVKPGMIVSVTGRARVRQKEDGTVSISSTLPTVKLSSTVGDKAVFGVLVAEMPLPDDHWYQAKAGKRFATVNALGEGRVWVSNISGDIRAGDYITTSAFPGYGQLQDDDLLHSYTLGKAIEDIDWGSVTETIEFNGQTYKVHLMAIVYTSG